MAITVIMGNCVDLTHAEHNERVLFNTFRKEGEGRPGFQKRFVEENMKDIRFEYQKLHELSQNARYYHLILINSSTNSPGPLPSRWNATEKAEPVFISAQTNKFLQTCNHKKEKKLSIMHGISGHKRIANNRDIFFSIIQYHHYRKMVGREMRRLIMPINIR